MGLTYCLSPSASEDSCSSNNWVVYETFTGVVRGKLFLGCLSSPKSCELDRSTLKQAQFFALHKEFYGNP